MLYSLLQKLHVGTRRDAAAYPCIFLLCGNTGIWQAGRVLRKKSPALAKGKGCVQPGAITRRAAMRMSRFACAGRALFLLCLVLLCCPLPGCGDSPRAPGNSGTQSAHGQADNGSGAALSVNRADHIRLDGLALLGMRSMAVPVFPHEQHVRVLAGLGKDCASCHLPLPAAENEQLGYSFHFLGANALLYPERPALASEKEEAAPYPLAGVAPERLKEHFHRNCISCHEQLVREGKGPAGGAVSAGPQAESCRSCHNARAADPPVFSSGYDKALHNRHIASSAIPALSASDTIPMEQRALLLAAGHGSKNCGACHRSYGPDLPSGGMWVPGEEDSCRACHLTRSEQTAILSQGLPADALEASGIGPLLRRISLEEAMHTACLSCHLSLREQAGQGAKEASSPSAGPVDCRGCHNPSYALAMQARIAEVPGSMRAGIVKASGSFPVSGRQEDGQNLEALPAWAWNPARERGLIRTAGTDEQDAGAIPRLERGQPDAVLILAAPLPSFVTDSGTGSGFMSPVSFNHAFHEGRVSSCRSCHHVKIAACASCHLIGGPPEPGRGVLGSDSPRQLPQVPILEGGPQRPSPVPLSLAMHAVDSQRSCVGCHNRVKEQAVCAGCHISLPVKASQGSCASCHAMPPGLARVTGWKNALEAGKQSRTPETGVPGKAHSSGFFDAAVPNVRSTLSGRETAPSLCAPSGSGSEAGTDRDSGANRRMLDGSALEKRALMALDKDVWKQLADEAALMREQLRLYPRKEADIPEIIRADILQYEYQPVHMPHITIIQALQEGQAGSRLAGVFHADRDVLCQTCHHHSPASRTPPRCVSCHPLAESAAFGSRPSLKAAYHQRCFGCHMAMTQQPLPTDCQGCHMPVLRNEPGRAVIPETAPTQSSEFFRNSASPLFRPGSEPYAIHISERFQGKNVLSARAGGGS